MKELKDGQHLIVAASSGSLQDVNNILNAGDNLDLMDVKEACLKATSIGHTSIVESILKAYPHNFIAGKVLIEAVTLNDLSFIKLLLSYHPEWTDCAMASAEANKLGYTAIYRLIAPDKEPPKELKKKVGN